MIKRTKNKDKKPKRISSAVADAIISGENWLEATQILQALSPVKDLLTSQINGLESILDEFREKGGQITLNEHDDGYDIISVWNDVTWQYLFDKNGNKIDLIIRDSTPEHASPETMGAVKKALEAAYEIPRREFALEELSRIVSYVENDNALAGLEKIRELLSDNENVVYATATADRLSEVVSPLMDVKD